MKKTEQKIRVGITQRSALRIEEDRIGPIGGAGKNMAPVLDQREGDVAILAIAEGAVEAGKQPPAKDEGEARRKQREGEP